MSYMELKHEFNGINADGSRYHHTDMCVRCAAMHAAISEDARRLKEIQNRG